MDKLNEIFENDKEIERDRVHPINLHDMDDPVFQEEHNISEHHCFSFYKIVRQPISVDQPPQFTLELLEQVCPQQELKTVFFVSGNYPCCMDGNIQIPRFQQCPEKIQHFFLHNNPDSRNFCEHIHSYIFLFSMVSIHSLHLLLASQSIWADL